MKSRPLIAVLASVFVMTGCVTEGARPTEPQSADEAARANLDLGVGYIRENRPDAAVSPLRRAIELDSRLVEAHTAIAIAYDQLGEIELAEEHHGRATRIDRRDPSARNAFAVFLCRQGRWSDAQGYFDEAIADVGRGSPVPTMLNAATCAREAGNLIAAEDYFRAALDQEPENAEVLRGLMDVSVRSENYLAARAFWQRLDRSGAVGPEDLSLCIRIEGELDDSAASLACRNRLLSEFPGSRQASRLRELN